MKGNVLRLLRQNRHQFISGEKISEELQCSRTMVWKYIDALRKEGYEIEAVSNKGYQLKNEPNEQEISEHAIISRLDEGNMFHTVVVYDIVESTQNEAIKLINEGATSGTVVIAEEQRSGRGRLGRNWFSPTRTGIWMSLVVKPNIPIHRAPQLTLLTAVAAARGVEQITNVDVEIKWPNDLLINGKKVCGILTEMQADPDKINAVIIGIGLNVNQQEFPLELKEIATSLSKETNNTFSRIEIISSILHEFHWLYEEFVKNGFSIIKPLWEAKCHTLGKKITATTMQEEITGIALGIDDDGVLLLRDENGKIHKIYSGDISKTS